MLLQNLVSSVSSVSFVSHFRETNTSSDQLITNL